MKRFARSLFALAALWLLTAPAHAALTTNSWINSASQFWGNLASWSAGVAPTNTDAAILITNASTKTVTINSATPSGNLTISNLTVQGFGAGINTLQLTNVGVATPLRLINSLLISNGGAILVTNSALYVDAASGGSNIVNGTLTMLTGGTVTGTIVRTFVGSLAGSPGTITIAGGHLQEIGTVTFGVVANSTGTVWVTGGELINSNNTTVIGLAGTGQMIVSNGTVSLRRLVAGNAAGGVGTITAAGGDISLGLFVSVGGAANATGTLWMTGGQLTVTNSTTFVGNNGVGQATMSNGLWLASDVIVAAGAGSEGSLTIEGGTMIVEQLLLTNGLNSVFTFNGGTLISGGTTVSNFQNFVIGDTGSGGATFIANGGLHRFTNALMVVGNQSVGNRMVISNAASVANGTGFIGSNTTSTGNSVLVSGNNSVWSNQFNLSVGRNGAGNQLIVTNGGTVFNDLGVLGSGSSSSNNVAVVASGSVWSNRSSLYVGNNGAGNQLIVTDGGTVFNNSCYLGVNSSSSNNVAVVTGTGSVWSNGSELFVGYNGAGSQLLVTNGGTVGNDDGYLGYNSSSSNNVAVVTGTSSVWSNSSGLFVGDGGAGNQLIVTNGGTVLNDAGILGDFSSSSNNLAVVSGNGANWQNRRDLYIGWFGDTNTLTIGTGGSVLASNAFVGFDPASVGNKINVTGGSLFVTNAPGTGTLDIRRGTLTFDGGSVTVDRLLLTIGTSSVIVFNGGTLHAKGTAVTNSQQFVVGDGASAATFHLLGGVHSFKDGLRIRNAASLTGCGTITGSVLVDAGGTVVADCGGTLTFTGIVTNNGVMRAINGTVLEGSGSFVNNGLIDAIFGATNFPAGVINNGIILDAASDYDGDGQSNLQEALAGTDPTDSASVFRITAIAKEASDIRVTWIMGSGKTNALQRAPGGNYDTNNFIAIFTVTNTAAGTTNYLDIGAATNVPALYYRVRLVP